MPELSFEEEVARFKKEWAKANERRMVGYRTEFGLMAIWLELKLARDTSVCLICHGEIRCISAPGDFWWAHTQRPEDYGEKHDASPAGWVHEAAFDRHKEDYTP